MAIVAAWHEFESGAPEMAAAAVMLWPGIIALDRGQPVPPGTPCFAIAFLATVRPDGSPRLHPFCPVLAGGRLLAAIPPLLAPGQRPAARAPVRDSRPARPQG
jgi:hypothetical protein